MLICPRCQKLALMDWDDRTDLENDPYYCVKCNKDIPRKEVSNYYIKQFNVTIDETKPKDSEDQIYLFL